ncbi:uncharacterized protein A1O9_09538 [Exophiala aquamarina CBS 119918]|uniref:BD-FAE-like domain-containing protein n=1 Tax=Exophiala aquamarina CBS 119918 TaxID=1182545 RepID=A0A072P3U1_9EURO|nr:uncharacterized protein A1O9_09538 [Exophiala aquamarina CBS 119918]KEF54372.1 hypothetical protein A1O9_09538 [Exophiala aquamarina CBS 119918]
MDLLPPLGRDVMAAVVPTFKVFGDLLRQPERLALLQATRREEHRYGDHPRQILDLYCPSKDLSLFTEGENARQQGRPVFVFIYGGGFARGDRIEPAIDGEVVYKGLGYFMAEQLGYDTVIMDYRLLQHGATFNSGGEDLDLVVTWIENNLCKKNDREPSRVTTREMVIMGNSAGGVHLTSWLFDDAFASTRKRFVKNPSNLRLKAAVVLSSTMLLDPNIPAMRSTLLGYYGTEEDVVRKSPLNLMSSATSAKSGDTPEHSEKKSWPHILLITTEFDPEFVAETGKTFLTKWISKGGKGDYWELEGHNHLSPPLALGTGNEEAEAWGFELGVRLAQIN